MSGSRIALLVFSNTTVRAGAEEHILQLLAGLDRALFVGHFACTPQLAEAVRKDLPSDVELFTLTLDSPRDLRGAFKLARILRHHRIQILHSHMFRASLFAS